MRNYLQTIRPKTWLTLVGLFVCLYLVIPGVAFANVLTDSLEAVLFALVANLTGWLLYVGGTLLDYGINTFVINFGLIYTTGGVGVAVDQLWVLVRDLFNILFIFGLVYIGFKMIMNSDDSGTKKHLAYLIMAALLINFSLFITKFVVDFTNILATEIAVAGFELAENGTGSNIDGDARNVRIGDTFFNLMGISKVVLEMPENIKNGERTAWSYIFGIGIINIVGAFAFGVGGIMLIIRFIALSVYMVLSPFMFLGWIFPGFQGMSSKYWMGFLKQSFYAPVYVVMIFFAATILNNLFKVGGSAQGGGIGDVVRENNNIFSPTAANVSTAADSFAGGLGPFILTAGFLIAAVQVGNKLAGDGSQMMGTVTKSVNSRVRGAVRGGARFGARNTVGYGAMGVGAASNAAANSRAYRRLNTKLGTSSLDRNVAAGMDGVLAAGGRASIAGSRTAAEQKKVVRARQNQVNSQRDITGREDAISTYLKHGSAEDKGKAAGAIAKLSDDELRNLSSKQLKDERIISLMSEAQLKTLAETGVSTKEEIKDLKDRRQEAIFAPLLSDINGAEKSVEDLGTAMDDLAKTVKNLSTEQLEAMDKDRLNSEPIAVNLTDKQLDAMRDSGKTPPAQLDAIKKTRAEGFTSIASTGGTKGQAIPTGSRGEEFAKKQREKLVKGSAQDVGKLPAEVFMNPDIIGHITPAALQQRMRNGLNEKERGTIETEIRKHITTGTKEGDRARKTWQKWSNSTTEGASFDFTTGIN